MMKSVIKEVEKKTVYGGSDTVNHEGFYAWSMDDRAMLEQLAVTGTLGRSFYASESAAVEEALALMERVSADDLAAAIVKGRNEGFIRTFPILGLAVLSKKDPEKFRSVFMDVVKTGNDLEDFIDAVHKMRGLGRSIKSAIHAWLREKATPYYAMKYRRQLADAIRVSRFAGEDPLYAYILGAYKNTRGNSKEKINAVYEAYPEFAARKKFLQHLEAKEFEAAAAVLSESRLDIDSLSAFYSQFDTVLWSAVAERAPIMKFIKYMDKFLREGVELGQITEQKLTADALKAAKVLPFRLYPAWCAVKKQQKGAQEGEHSSSAAAAAETLQRVLEEYTQVYDWSTFNRHSWVVAPDMSGSMSCGNTNGSLTFAGIGGMFTAFFAKGLDKVEIIPWDTEVQPYDISPDAPVMEQIRYVEEHVGGGTHMEVPVEEMIRKRIMADWSVFITDSEEYGEGWYMAWKKYRKINPNAKAIMLRLDSYHCEPMDEAKAEADGIWEIFGWNDSVLDYIKFIVERN